MAAVRYKMCDEIHEIIEILCWSWALKAEVSSSLIYWHVHGKMWEQKPTYI